MSASVFMHRRSPISRGASWPDCSMAVWRLRRKQEGPRWRAATSLQANDDAAPDSLVLAAYQWRQGWPRTPSQQTTPHWKSSTVQAAGQPHQRRPRFSATAYAPSR